MFLCNSLLLVFPFGLFLLFQLPVYQSSAVNPTQYGYFYKQLSSLEACFTASESLWNFLKHMEGSENNGFHVLVC